MLNFQGKEKKIFTRYDTEQIKLSYMKLKQLLNQGQILLMLVTIEQKRQMLLKLKTFNLVDITNKSFTLKVCCGNSIA